MELLGVKIKNFACFEEFFLPLTAGVNLLVGRNNTGKTALLRALSCLGALPFEPVAELDPELVRYCTGEPGSSSFTLSVWFRLGDADAGFFDGPEERWRSLVRGQQVRVIFEFGVWPMQRLTGLKGASLEFGGKSLPIIFRQHVGGLVHTIPDTQGNPRTTEFLGGGGPAAPDGMECPRLAAQGCFSGFGPLKSVLFIRAHRITAPEQSLQSQDVLTPNAENLPQFLQTLFGRDRNKFSAIEEFLCRVFPEFEHLNPQSERNLVSITLTLRGTGRRVRLSHCGTGVEQILALATFVITFPPGSIILLDEPHAYLHPSAERELMSFLESHGEHTYVIATHSPLIINATLPGRITSLDAVSSETQERCSVDAMCEVLRSLGYKNSDFLFNDRIVFVEGDSDAAVLPVLLRNSKDVDVSALQRTGFAVVNGKGGVLGRRDRRAKEAQSPILWYEKFLAQLGKARMPHTYLFDGDWSPEERRVLTGTKSPATGEPVAVQFLLRCELENYLLVADAIVAVIQEICALQEMQPPRITPDSVRARIQELLDSDDEDLFPHGKSGDQLVAVKGSNLLEKLFGESGIAYEKKKVGTLLASKVTIDNQPALHEVSALLKDLYG